MSGCFSSIFAATGEARLSPQVDLNGKPAVVTVQDLSGLATRPLRVLMNRNNRARHAEFLRVYALGVHQGDLLRMQLLSRTPGTRATVYKIFREETEGARFLSMPASVYLGDALKGEFLETINSAGEEFLIVVYEKTDRPEEKSLQVRYFEERFRKLVIASFKTNLMFSSLKLKMKDLGDDAAEGSFERDAQLLIDRLERPQEIILLRLWKIKK